MAVNLRDEAINELVGKKPPLHLNEIWAIRMCNEAGREEYGVGECYVDCVRYAANGGISMKDPGRAPPTGR